MCFGTIYRMAFVKTHVTEMISFYLDLKSKQEKSNQTSEELLKVNFPDFLRYTLFIISQCKQISLKTKRAHWKYQYSNTKEKKIECMFVYFGTLENTNVKWTWHRAPVQPKEIFKTIRWGSTSWLCIWFAFLHVHYIHFTRCQ